MKRRYLILSPILPILICSIAPAYDHEHEHESARALVTVDPNLFAPGQDISHATYGATLRSVNFIPNPDPNAPPQQAAIPKYSPVFAEATNADCTLEPGFLLPCAPMGNNVLSYTSSSASQASPVTWGVVRIALPCFTGQCTAVPNILFPLLRADFAEPTDSVSVILENSGGSDGDVEAFSTVSAYDGTGQSIGNCFSEAMPPQTGPTCRTEYVLGPVNGSGWVKVTFSDPSARIRLIVVGGVNIAPVGVVQFDSPVSLQLHGLLEKVRDIRRLGRGLEYKVMFAEAYYEARDIRAACEQLTAFEHEVKAQADKHITELTVLQLLSTSIAIGNALSCHAPQ